MADPTDMDQDADIAPPSSEQAPKGRHVAVSHHGKVTTHATPEAAAKAQDAHHRTAVARNARHVGRAIDGKK